MAEPFIGEVKLISWTYPPKGWAFCDGTVLGITQNQALFSILGTTYGGDGVRTFGLPDLRGRTPVHQGTNPYNRSTWAPGQIGGEEAHTLTSSEVPQHGHALQASALGADQTDPTGAVLATANTPLYHALTKPTTLSPSTVGSVGGQPHPNMQPYLALNFVIALVGIFPSRT